MQNVYKLIIAYEGTHYGGWQIQPNAISIQEKIQEALKISVREEVTVIGSGRTDAGAHALKQTAHFKSDQPLNLYRLLASLNGLLPHDIRILNIEKVDSSFHAQYSAIGKIYHYHLWLDKVQSPFKRFYSYHVHHPVNQQLLQNAADLFIGMHDFTSFANEAHSGSASRDPVRTITRLNLILQEGGMRLEFDGDGFLYKMVRNIVGTLLEVAGEKRSLDDISQIFAAKDRRAAGQAAPAHALFLVDVLYPPF